MQCISQTDPCSVSLAVCSAANRPAHQACLRDCKHLIITYAGRFRSNMPEPMLEQLLPWMSSGILSNMTVVSAGRGNPDVACNLQRWNLHTYQDKLACFQGSLDSMLCAGAPCLRQRALLRVGKPMSSIQLVRAHACIADSCMCTACMHAAGGSFSLPSGQYACCSSS